MKKFRPDPFPTDTPSSYPRAFSKELFQAILEIKTPDEAAKFFRDLLTMAEIEEFANRWQMVKLLTQGLPYIKIAQKLHVSTATVTRVAHWLHNGMGGYKAIAERVFSKNKKSSSKLFHLRGKRTWL